MISQSLQNVFVLLLIVGCLFAGSDRRYSRTRLVLPFVAMDALLGGLGGVLRVIVVRERRERLRHMRAWRAEVLAPWCFGRRFEVAGASPRAVRLQGAGR